MAGKLAVQTTVNELNISSYVAKRGKRLEEIKERINTVRKEIKEINRIICIYRQKSIKRL